MTAPATRRTVPPSLQSIQPLEEGFCQVMRFSLSWQGASGNKTKRNRWNAVLLSLFHWFLSITCRHGQVLLTSVFSSYRWDLPGRSYPGMLRDVPLITCHSLTPWH